MLQPSTTTQLTHDAFGGTLDPRQWCVERRDYLHALRQCQLPQREACTARTRFLTATAGGGRAYRCVAFLTPPDSAARWRPVAVMKCRPCRLSALRCAGSSAASGISAARSAGMAGVGSVGHAPASTSAKRGFEHTVCIAAAQAAPVAGFQGDGLNGKAVGGRDADRTHLEARWQTARVASAAPGSVALVHEPLHCHPCERWRCRCGWL